MEYLKDSLRVLGDAVEERLFSVEELVLLAEERGEAVTERYTLVTGGMKRHEVLFTGLPLLSLLRLCGLSERDGKETEITAWFKDGYRLSLPLSKLKAAAKPVLIAYAAGGLPLVGPTGREPVYKKFGPAEGLDPAAGNSGGPLRLVAEGLAESVSNAPGCGKWLAALTVGGAGGFVYRRETDEEPGDGLPPHVEPPRGTGRFLTLAVCGREERLGFEELRGIRTVSALFAARDGRHAFEGFSMSELIGTRLRPGEEFPERITVTAESGYSCRVERAWLLDGVESTYQPGERREPILAYAGGGMLLRREAEADGLFQDGAPLRLIVENHIACWVKNVCRIEACPARKEEEGP